MPRLSKAQEEARRRVIDLTAAGLPPTRLAARLMAAVQAAIGWDGYRLFAVDPATLLVNRLLAASDNDGWARLEWLREVYLAAGPIDYIELPNLMRLGLPAVAFQDRQESSWGYPPDVLAALPPADHARLFHELRSPVGGTLLAAFAAGGRWVAALQAYRREPRRPYRAGDVAFLRLLVPAIGSALAAAIARERARASTRQPDAAGVILLGPDGGVRFATPAGEAWLDQLDDVDRSAHAPLPTAVWAALAGLRAGGPEQTAARLVVPTRAGPVRVEASPAGSGDAVAILIAPERPPAPPGVPPEWPLTPQERRIVELILHGKSNREIADALFVGEHTVEWHLRRAYEKVGVRSRTQLMARFFRETFLPEVASDEIEVDAEIGDPARIPDLATDFTSR